jgi:hypothetical protein
MSNRRDWCWVSRGCESLSGELSLHPLAKKPERQVSRSTSRYWFVQKDRDWNDVTADLCYADFSRLTGIKLKPGELRKLGGLSGLHLLEEE